MQNISQYFLTPGDNNIVRDENQEKKSLGIAGGERPERWRKIPKQQHNLKLEITSA